MRAPEPPRAQPPQPQQHAQAQAPREQQQRHEGKSERRAREAGPRAPEK
jgi:hypothetical protein